MPGCTRPHINPLYSRSRRYFQSRSRRCAARPQDGGLGLPLKTVQCVSVTRPWRNHGHLPMASRGPELARAEALRQAMLGLIDGPGFVYAGKTVCAGLRNESERMNANATTAPISSLIPPPK